MGVSAIYGLPGRGKSHFALFYSIFLANRYEKKLVLTFYINPVALAYYCYIMGYQWLIDNFSSSIYYINLENPCNILAISDSVIFADEIGNEMDSLKTWENKNRKQFLTALRQVRHESQYLIITGQHEKQIDAQIRYLIEEIFYCNGISAYSKKLKNEALYNMRVRRFTPENYEQWMSNPKLRKNPLKSRLVSNKSWIRFITAADLFIFNIYDSFTRLEYQEKKNYDCLNYEETEIRDRHGKRLNVEIIKIKGEFPYQPHEWTWLIRFLFVRLPDNFKDQLVKLDNKLSKRRCFLNLKRLSKLEKKILKLIGFFIIVPIFINLAR